MRDIKGLISQMTVEEKASLCSGKNFWELKGIDRLGIPRVMVADGPHGLRKELDQADHIGLNESLPATCFPTASALAATWNRDLLYQVGAALGEECRQEKVSVILGPGANIKRSPLCGRNFEYFSEDPYLSGEMAKSYINGVQSQGVGTSLKHYAVNNQETRRMSIDALVDERALREIYLAGFEIAVKEAQPWTVMGAYNRVNGTYCCEHPHLMAEILKEEWGHEGLVVSDWGAMNERVPALKAGVELEMPGANNGNDELIVDAVKSGILDESVLDAAVERILAMIFKAQKTLSEDYVYDAQTHHRLARIVAAEGAVLLKNEGGLLPLKGGIRIAVIGRFAKEPRYQGAGSSLMNPSRLDNFYAELVKLVGEEQVSYAPGYTKRADYPDEILISEAVYTARDADVVLVCAGLTDLYETEGLDRTHMKMPPGHDALIERLAAEFEKVVVVLSNGAPVEMPWVDDVPAILEGYLGGQAGAGALADILTGRVTPCGKLAETFPIHLEDNPSHPYFPMGPATVEYRESIYVGYRYFDSVNEEVLFPFGHGLSYTTFEYRDLVLSSPQISDTENLTVSLKVKNTGGLAGKEVVQVYVRDVESTVFRPEKELKGFAKLSLEPGEEKQISIELSQRAFAFYNTELDRWHVESGSFEILIGASSRDLRLKGEVEVVSSQPEAPDVDKDNLSVYYNFPKGAPVSQEAFQALLGRPLPVNQLPRKGEFTMNTPLKDMKDSFIGRVLFNLISSLGKKEMGDDQDSPTTLLMEAMMAEMPLRGILMAGGDKISRGMLVSVLEMLNGRFFKGLRELIRSRKR
ncbi:MAG: glycoside hydrolase family 3 C-terminal domain-containing protein [Anaerolineales bacterium]|nr:glycoside hydrolase family 3 C-terminal domain-containing protein [Anaerolineales bacterium]